MIVSPDTNMEKLLMFTLLLLSGLVKAENLQCYVCNDCDSVNDSQKQVCTQDSIATTTPASGEGTTAEGTTAEATTAEGTTAEATTAEGTTAEATTAEGTTAEVTTVEATTVEATTVEATTVEVTTVEATTVEVTTVEVTTEEFVTEDTGNGGELELEDQDNGKRSRRAILRVLGENRAEDSSNTRCVVTTYEVEGQKKTVRGCSFDEGDNTARCKEVLGGIVSGNLTRCDVCDKNFCNSATKSAVALLPLVLSIFLAYK